MRWTAAALKRLITRSAPVPYRSVHHRDAYGWHMPHYAYGADYPDCSTCGCAYPCRTVRNRAHRGNQR